jgi:phage baseplate assembly protein W
MAIEIRINPIDFDVDVAIGIDMPMIASGAAFKQTYTTLDQAVANAKNLLLTNRGERIMQPDFGCNISNTLFENITETITVELEQNIKSSFNYWLPYIFINELSVTSNQDENRIFINLKMSLEGNKFDTRSIQLEVLNNQ